MPASSKKSGLPWKLSAIETLKLICGEASKLEIESEGPTVGLLAHRQSKFRNFDTANEALARHPIYIWLRLKLPRAIALADTFSAGQRFRFLWLVAGCIYHCHAQAHSLPAGPDRLDKTRLKAHAAIQRVEPFIADGTIGLTAAKTEMLSRLLAEARSELMAIHGSRSPLWALEKFARDVQRDFAIADTKLIFDIADRTDLVCSVRTARRIVSYARSP